MNAQFVLSTSDQGLTVLRHKDYLHLPHGFFGREGGVSQGPFASLNGKLWGQDLPENVQENRTRALRCLYPNRPATLCIPYQDHTTHAHWVEDPSTLLEHIPADALVTNHPEVCIGVVTADCAPVLFYDPTVPIVGVAHAGWRGAVLGILENTLGLMMAKGARPESVVAFIGPTIHPENYQVQEDFFQEITQRHPDTQDFFIMHEQRIAFDLPGYVRFRLLKQLTHIYQSDYNTFGNLFFSRRYALSQGLKDFGCYMSLIGLP